MESSIQANTSRLLVRDSRFPPSLLFLESPPKQLWVWGKAPWWEWWAHQPRIAVIGSRRMSPYGRMAIHALVSELVARFSAKVVSGCALGADTEAQISALQSGGNVVGILGGGLNCMTPRTFRAFSPFVENGQAVILSEYPPDAPATKWQFPERNRLIAALADGVLIIEAQQNSGTLITAGAALAAGKEVAVVTQPFQSPNVAGVIRLVERGAHLIATADQIMDALFPGEQLSFLQKSGRGGKKTPEKNIQALATSPLESGIVQILSEHNGFIEELECRSECQYVKKIIFSLAQWQESLILLELRGVITRDLGMIRFGRDV